MNDEAGNTRKNNTNNRIIFYQLFFLLIISIFCTLSLEIGNQNNKLLEAPIFILNMGTIFLSLLFWSFLLKTWFSVTVHALVLHIWAIANYYVIMYRGVPLVINDVFNIGTAANVIGSYRISFPLEICIILVFFIMTICMAFALWKQRNNVVFENKRNALCYGLIIICLGGGFIYTGYISDNSLKPHSTLTWSWRESYHQYGYVASTLEVFMQSLDPVEKPVNYDETYLSSFIKNNVEKNEYLPDIILILNETYYDLSEIINLTTDKQYMDYFNSLDNTVRGYAVVPAAGGGTNSSEYELLTSNSLELAPGITPFNTLNLKNANSIVSFLEKYEYNTIGAHSEYALNYSRGKAYPDLGFDKIYFDGDFYNLTYYKDRWYETDECLYENAIRMYGNLPEENPRMLYLLTIQNHGGWDMNAPEDDIIHIEEDYGEYTEQINEYLSCLYLSDLALQNLINYYENIDRPVVICMVGDHSPAFVNELVDVSNEKINLKMHSTPFLIWANYPIEEKNLGYIGINAIVPNLMSIAGIPLSPYYQYILDMQEQVPVLTSRGIYYDKNGVSYGYDEKTQYTDLVNQYFNMEYNNIGKHADRKQQLFEP